MQTIRLNKFGIIVILLLIITTMTSIFLFYKLKITKSESKEEISNLSIEEKVSKLIFLPKNESPTILEISSLEQIKNEPFFANAIIGDIVLVYVDARKAFIYRESENKIVDLAPLRINTEPVASTTGTSKVSTSTVIKN